MGVSFTSWQFAAVGALCAAGPLIIHLLNRRRYRVVEWAAMEFLRRALKQNRRILQIRDLILLVVRTLAVLLFGLALARPYIASRQEALDERQPLHAVLVIDNSLSMAYQTLEGSLLDQAKEQARGLIERLPAGSRISLVAACGTREALPIDPYETKESAIEALARIEPVDRSAELRLVASGARRACEAAPEMAKRIVLFTDEQALNWRDAGPGEALEELPPLVVVPVSAGLSENTWIADVRLQDGLADMETTATVVVAVAHQGSTPRRDLVVRLSQGDNVLGERTVTLEPGLGTREVDFEVRFSELGELPEPDRPVFVPLRASLTPDRLAADDERYLAVPVVAALPVVFIDQYGPDQEDVVRGRIGETRQLRRLLAPRTSRAGAPRQLIHVRHVTPADVTRDVLADARLVVVAGLRDPGELVPLLRQYVEQGGQLVLAAGADFDPAVWNDAAWLEGRGVLPLALEAAPIGHAPEESSASLAPFFLAFESLAGEAYFQLAGVAEAELKDLYAEPFFFKAVKVDDAAETITALVRRERERLLDAQQESKQAAHSLRLNWLVWAAADDEADDPSAADGFAAATDSADEAANIDTLASARAPHVLARYDLPGRPPFLVSRRIGRGRVVFCSTGLSSSWNTLSKTNAMLVFDRLLRGMIQSTLPRRNLEPVEQWTLPLPRAEANLLVSLTRPREPLPEPVDIGYIGADRRGVTLSGLLARGVYRVAGYRLAAAGSPAGAERPVWELPLVVGGSSEESDLTPLARSQAEQFAQATGASWLGPGDEISLAGAAVRGQGSWWWLALSVLLLLALEMTVIAWPTRSSVPAVPVRATFA
jgi:hypothetical protein